MAELGIDREQVLGCEQPLEALVAATRRVVATLTEGGQKRQGRRALGRGITSREVLVLRLVAEGRTSKDISHHLGLSVRTVENHRRELMRKFAVGSGAALVRAAIRDGVIEP